MDQYFVFGSLFDYCEVMCGDILSLPNVEFVNVKEKINNKFLYFVYKIHNSGIANRICNLPLKKIWYKYFFDTTRIIGGV